MSSASVPTVSAGIGQVAMTAITSSYYSNKNIVLWQVGWALSGITSKTLILGHAPRGVVANVTIKGSSFEIEDDDNGTPFIKWFVWVDVKSAVDGSVAPHKVFAYDLKKADFVRRGGNLPATVTHKRKANTVDGDDDNKAKPHKKLKLTAAVSSLMEELAEHPEAALDLTEDERTELEYERKLANAMKGH
ncbi:hypothetical protein NX059_004053 [Plenodomus lindquistii]|nr:hypothetical protein NX059_004053 [Plenodomus lindquistii]